MRKPEGLGRLLLKSVPSLAADPSKLQMFVEKGRVAARAGDSLNFVYRYELSIVVQDFAGDVDRLFVPIIAWIAEQQPDLLERGELEPFTFEAELLDGDACDIDIRIELSELVLVTAGSGAGWTTSRVDERAIGLDEFPGICGVPLWRLFLDQELVATSDDPAALATA